MPISTNTLRFAITALDHEIDRVSDLPTEDEDEASDNGQLVLDMSRALGELRDILETGAG